MAERRVYYDGARDAMEAPMEPKTPCRNMATRPCTRLVTDDRERFPIRECLPHHCARFTDHYEEGKIPHEWALNEDGTAKTFELGDHHDGPYCVRCEIHYCCWCDPDVWTGTCATQDTTLF